MPPVPRWKPFSPPEASGILPMWPGCAAHALSRRRRSKGAGTGPKPRSRRSPVAIGCPPEYLQDEDIVAQWIAEGCTVGEPSRYKETNAALFGSWREWCERLGEQPGSQKSFSQALIRARFEPCSVGHGRGFAGLTLKSRSL